MLTKGNSGKSRDIFRSIYRFIQNALVVSEVTADMKYGIIVTELNKVDLHTNECKSARGRTAHSVLYVAQCTARHLAGSERFDRSHGTSLRRPAFLCLLNAFS